MVMDPLQAAGTFACLFMLDVIWVFYTKAVVAKAEWRAASWCALLTSMNAISAVLYVGNPWLIIPAVLGAFAGTFVAMKMPEDLRTLFGPRPEVFTNLKEWFAKFPDVRPMPCQWPDCRHQCKTPCDSTGLITPRCYTPNCDCDLQPGSCRATPKA